MTKPVFVFTGKGEHSEQGLQMLMVSGSLDLNPIAVFMTESASDLLRNSDDSKWLQDPDLFGISEIYSSQCSQNNLLNNLPNPLPITTTPIDTKQFQRLVAEHPVYWYH